MNLCHRYNYSKSPEQNIVFDSEPPPCEDDTDEVPQMGICLANLGKRNLEPLKEWDL